MSTLCTRLITADIIAVSKIMAGGIDTHVHFINPEQAEVALESGITTHIGGENCASDVLTVPGPLAYHRSCRRFTD